jgi:hypothetical protein
MTTCIARKLTKYRKLFSPIELFIHPQKWSNRAMRRFVTRQYLDRAGATTPSVLHTIG